MEGHFMPGGRLWGKPVYLSEIIKTEESRLTKTTMIYIYIYVTEFGYLAKTS